MIFFFVMIRRPPRSTRTAPLFPNTTRFRSRRPDAEPDRRQESGRRRVARGAAGHQPASRARHQAAIPASKSDGGAVPNGLARSSAAHAERPRGASADDAFPRSEEHTSELQSLLRISYAVFCLKKKKPKKNNQTCTMYS